LPVIMVTRRHIPFIIRMRRVALLPVLPFDFGN